MEHLKPPAWFPQDPAPSFAGKSRFYRDLSRQALLELEAADMPRKCVADDLGINEGHLSRILNPDKQDRLSIEMLIVWTRRVGPSVLQFVARRSGGRFVEDIPQAERGQSSDSLIGALAGIGEEFGRLNAETLRALEDHQLTAKEKQALWVEACKIERLLREYKERLGIVGVAA